MAVPEGVLRRVKEVLRIDERDSALAGGLNGHLVPQNEITPPEAFRRVERGADDEMITGRVHLRKYPRVPAIAGPLEAHRGATWPPPPPHARPGGPRRDKTRRPD